MRIFFVFLTFEKFDIFLTLKPFFLKISFGDSRIYLMNGFIPRIYACIRMKNIKRLHVFKPRTLKL